MIFVWVNKRDWRHPGPIVNVGAHNAHSLAALGHETHFVLGAGEASDTREDLASFYGLDAPPALQVHRVPRQRLGGAESSLSIFRAAVRLVKELAARDRVCVLTREGSFLPFLAWLCRDPRVCGFYEAHDFHADLSWRADAVTLQDRKQSWMERLCLPRIHGVVAIVQPQADLYAARFPRLPVVSLPLGTKPQDPGDPEARRALRCAAYVGHLHASKGVSLLMSAVRKPHHHLRARFLGGSPEQVARFEGEAQRRGWAERMTFTPFTAPETLHATLAREVSLGVVPLKDTFYNARLTCPAKALDYLSHGLPVVASDLPTTRDVLGDAAVYLPDHKAGRWAKVLKRLLKHPDEYAERSAASWRRAQELAWPNRARRLVEFVGQHGVR